MDIPEDDSIQATRLMTENIHLWDDQTSTTWTEAYPVGNGRLGAMPFGDFPQERILLNEDSVWEGGFDMKMPSDSFDSLNEVHHLVAQGKTCEADRLFSQKIQQRKDPYSYCTLGHLTLNYGPTHRLKSVRRELNLATGLSTCEYTTHSHQIILQTVYASEPDQVLVVHVHSTTAFDLTLGRDGQSRVEGQDLVWEQAMAHGGTLYQTRVRALGIEALADGERLHLKNIFEITLLISVATNVDRRHLQRRLADGWQNQNRTILDRLKSMPECTLRHHAMESHQAYFGRVSLNLGHSDLTLTALPTKSRLERIQKNQGDDPELMATYFQFGRYLLIASSRPGSLPANLQGIWNPHYVAPWSSDYHLTPIFAKPRTVTLSLRNLVNKSLKNFLDSVIVLDLGSKI